MPEMVKIILRTWNLPSSPLLQSSRRQSCAAVQFLGNVMRYTVQLCLHLHFLVYCMLVRKQKHFLLYVTPGDLSWDNVIFLLIFLFR